MTTTSIQWTDATWNPVRGCAVVSPGCANCYAMKQAHRFAGPGQPYEGLTRLTKGGPVWSGRARFVPEMLGAPLSWRKPRRVFVNSMSDLFHEDVSADQIAAVWAVMTLAHYHTFQVLTKRPERMRAVLTSPDFYGAVLAEADRIRYARTELCMVGISNPSMHPPRNVWLGVSAENQKAAEERIPLLLQTPAAVRFVSAEPLLGPLDLSRWMWPVHWRWDGRYATPEEATAAGARAERHRQALVSKDAVFLNWVIVGGESGPGARPCAEEWIARIVQQCAESHVPCFVKQLGAVPAFRTGEGVPISHRKGGDPAEWPEALRVRQFPEAHQTAAVAAVKSTTEGRGR